MAIRTQTIFQAQTGSSMLESHPYKWTYLFIPMNKTKETQPEEKLLKNHGFLKHTQRPARNVRFRDETRVVEPDIGNLRDYLSEQRSSLGSYNVVMFDHFAEIANRCERWVVQVMKIDNNDSESWNFSASKRAELQDPRCCRILGIEKDLRRVGKFDARNFENARLILIDQLWPIYGSMGNLNEEKCKERLWYEKIDEILVVVSKN